MLAGVDELKQEGEAGGFRQETSAWLGCLVNRDFSVSLRFLAAGDTLNKVVRFVEIILRNAWN